MIYYNTIILSALYVHIRLHNQSSYALGIAEHKHNMPHTQMHDRHDQTYPICSVRPRINILNTVPNKINVRGTICLLCENAIINQNE